MLFSTLVNNYYLPSISDLAPATISGYESALNCHILPRWGDTDADGIDLWEVERWLSGMSYGAARKSWTTMKRILRRGEAWGYVDNKLCNATPKMPKSRKRPRKALSKEQVRELLRGYWNAPLEPWLIVSVCLGLRREESCDLRWKDIDLRSGAVTINSTYQVIDGSDTEGGTKTPDSARTIYLPGFAKNRLREVKSTLHPAATDRLIGDRTPSQVAEQYHAFCKKHNLPWVPPTNLRHTWATLAIEAGVSPVVVAKCLGHKNLTMVYEHYLVANHDIFSSAARTMGKFLQE